MKLKVSSGACIELNCYVSDPYHIAPPPPASGFQVLYNVTVQDRGETYTGIGLNWTTTSRPVGSVRWLIDNKGIGVTGGYLTMDVLRNKMNATYDHILIIPWGKLNSLQRQTYSIQLDACTVNITTPEIILLPIASKRFSMHNDSQVV